MLAFHEHRYTRRENIMSTFLHTEIKVMLSYKYDWLLNCQYRTMTRLVQVTFYTVLSFKDNMSVNNNRIYVYLWLLVRTKATHTHSRAYGPDVIADFRQSACRWLYAVMNSVVSCHHLPPGTQRHIHAYHEPSGIGCHYFPPGPQLPSQPQGITPFRPLPTYTAWWQRHIGVRNLPRVFTPCAQPRIELTASWSQVKYSTDSATTPRKLRLEVCIKHASK